LICSTCVFCYAVPWCWGSWFHCHTNADATVVVVLHCCIPFGCNHLVNLMKTLDYSVSLELSKTLPMLAILSGKHEANKIIWEMFTYTPILLICLWKGKPQSKSLAGAFSSGLAVYKYGQCCSPRQARALQKHAVQQQRRGSHITWGCCICILACICPRDNAPLLSAHPWWYA